MGIHNESGHQTVSPIPPLSELIPRLIDMMTSTSDPDRSFIPFTGKDNLVLLVNNLGGLSELELGAVVAESRNALNARGFTISRVLSGSFMVTCSFQGSDSFLKFSTEQPEHARVLANTPFVTP